MFIQIYVLKKVAQFIYKLKQEKIILFYFKNVYSNINSFSYI